MMPFGGWLRRSAPALVITGSMMLGAGMAAGQPLFGALDSVLSQQLRFSAGRNSPIYAGAEVTITGQGFRPGQKVTLLYGTAPLGDELVADAGGQVSGRTTVPADAVSGNHPILVVAQGPYSASVANLKVSPRIAFSGQAGYDVTEGRVARGLYQSAYSERNKALFVTAAIGRPPVRQSELLRLDPQTLAVVARTTPQPAPAPAPRPGDAGQAPRDGGVYAVYGVGVDDANDTVWVTNSRQNTVAVYRQSDLSLVRQFEPGTVNHARDVVVDSSLGKAYASATFRPEIVAFNTRSPEVAKRIEVASRVRGGIFSAASLSLDHDAHRLYVVSNTTNEVAAINTRTDVVEKVLPVPGARSSIGVTHDPQTGRIFVAAQGSDNLVVLDGESGKVIADTPVGAGALNAVFDPVRRHVYVTSRGAGTITVVDVDGRIVANLGPAPLANHASTDRRGTVFVVDKSAGVREAESDTILRIRPRP
ncbi:YncE family protein [Roseomonas xinghualingensis]|uniref:YncE family protein n=1 Tax=Roseomonas xinghualingensis TaxID=2986475 RepID=UPI0021F227FF|nr:YncE family protein [Roseomonas sp. SXEYE001]MCV4207177.1 YncE family protein [Roseomonas sp. SXEYE001]